MKREAVLENLLREARDWLADYPPQTLSATQDDCTALVAAIDDALAPAKRK